MEKNTQNSTVSQLLCARESEYLSPYATQSSASLGRLRPAPDCEVRTVFHRDRDRSIYSNSFKRLKNKTQVFFAPDGDHYITRLTHTLDVSQIARSIARSLCLNEDLAEAIALGHDLGHTPFGHVGERVLAGVAECGFLHNEQSLRVVDRIEKNGKGLNLTQEVRDGILQHKSTGAPKTLEGQAVSIADRIAYINHDIEDAIRAGILKESDLPTEYVQVLGDQTKTRINTAISDIYRSSKGTPYVRTSKKVDDAIRGLRTFMFEKVYEVANKSIQERSKRMLEQLYAYFTKHVEKLPASYLRLLDEDGKARVVCDYISGMTDKYAIGVFESLFIPTTFSIGGNE